MNTILLALSGIWLLETLCFIIVLVYNLCSHNLLERDICNIQFLFKRSYELSPTEFFKLHVDGQYCDK